MNWFTKLRMIYKILLPVSITLVMVLSIMAWQIQTKGSDIVRVVAERELTALSGFYGAEVHRTIDSALSSAVETANLIATLEEAAITVALSREQLNVLLVNARAPEQIVAAGIALLPRPDDIYYVNALGSDAEGLFYPYSTDAGLEQLTKDVYKAKYFITPQKTKKAYLSDPNFYPIAGKDVLLLTVAAPIVVNDTFKGIVMLDLALNALSEMTNIIKVYESGVVSIVAQDGLIITNAVPELMLTNMFDSESWNNNTEIKKAFKAGEKYVAITTFDGVESFFYYHPIFFQQTGQTFYFAVIVPVHEVLAEVAELTNVTLIASTFALFTLLFVIFIGVRSSIKPLSQIVAAAEEVTRGNFAVKLDSKNFGGEILDLKLALEAMLGSLIENISKAEIMSKDAQEQTLKAQDAMREAEAARVAAEGAKREGMLAAAGQLENVVEIISTASQELSVQLEHSERASIEQAARMTETAVAMEEMNNTVLEVARNAGEASEISAQTRNQAESGAHIVQIAVVGIQRVQTVSIALKDDMSTLSEQAKSISEIMTVISDIADQTNLLALNAAIEAARAGDAGRGFAVVADEVRKLAEKTMASTTDVGNAIQSIQASVATSIRQVDQAVELIATATEQSTQSGDALNGIVGLVDSTADQVHAIAATSEEQSATSEKINRTIFEVNELSEESAQTMREAASAVNDLAVQVQALSALIDEMKQV